MKEAEIRPDALISRYRELSVRDAEACFAGTPRDPVPCVACGGGHSTPAFEKDGFPYDSCQDCGTLFQSPRPRVETFEAFYRNSESAKYWAEVFFPAVAEVRREKIFRPRAERLRALCAERAVRVERLIDVGAGFGIFLDEWRRADPGVQATAIEPSASLAAECRHKGFETIEDIAENVTSHRGLGDLVVCFEVLEHVHTPLEFLAALAALARPGGAVFVSTLGIDGFDLQTLWKASAQISPPHHINFLSVRGMTRLFDRAGFVDVHVTTPGQLDVDIVRNAFQKDAALKAGHRFLARLLDDAVRAEAFQRFLVEQRLSSHMWVIGRRPAAGAAA